MKIGVTSDTHSLKIPKQLIEDFKKVDLIIHAGDFCSRKDVEVFSRLGDFKAVHGNMDDSSVRNQFPIKQIVIVEDIKIGLYHGRGPRQMILQVVMQEFDGQKLDMIIYGHSHTPMNETINGTLYFNPGSPNDTVTAPFCSYGIIDVQNDKIKARIVKVK